MAVDPLVRGVRYELDGGGPDEYRVAEMCFCLGRIGGTEAEAFLEELVRERLRFNDWIGFRWGLVVCCAYAECGGRDAVPALIDLYERAAGQFADYQRTAAMCGLVRTASREAVAFALDHVDVLLSTLESDDQFPSSAATVTLESLLDGRDPTALSTSPIYRPMMLGIDERLLVPSVARDSNEPSAQSSRFGDTADLRGRWKRDGKRAVERWLDRLD